MSVPYRTECERLAGLERLHVLDTPPEPAFDGLVRSAAQACGMAISLLTLLDADRQWFKANVGLPGLSQIPRDTAFCHHTIAQDGVLEVPDATLDARFLADPLVTEAPGVRFYAGAPLRLSDGSRVGTLCVIGREPGQLAPAQRETLAHLARVAVELLEARRTARELTLSEARFRALDESSTHGVFATDAEGACTYTNERWQAIFGTVREEALGQGWSRALHPEDRHALVEEWWHAARRRDDFDREFRIRRGDGTVRHVRSVSRPVRGLGGEISGHVGSVEDVTERVQQRQALDSALRKLQVATESGCIGTWESDLRSRTSTWTSRMFALFGLPVGTEQVPLDAWLARVHPDDRDTVVRSLDRAAATAGRLDTEYRVVWDDGSVHHLRTSGRTVLDVHGAATRMVGVSWDVTPLRELTEELAEQHELLRVTLHSIGDAVITTDAGGRVTWLNPVAERLTGRLSAGAVGRPLRQVFRLVDERSRQAIDDPVTACLRSGELSGASGHALLIARDATERNIEDTAAPIVNREGVSLGAVLVFRDVTEQHRLSKEMTFRATHDALTGLVNRAEFEARLQARLESAQEERLDGTRGERSESALMYIDLDRFKLVNDACGHAAGDELLSEMAKMIGGIIRGGDTLARLGGDEFGAILDRCSADEALRIAQQICDRMETFRFAYGERRFRIGTSIGLVALGGRWEDASAAMQAADASCYVAKEAGRNRVHVWFDEDAAMQGRRGDMRWATRLTQALDEERFVLYMQRIESLGPNDGGLHAEVLIRLREADGRLIMPGAFLPAAERFHLVTRIDQWVLQSTVEMLSRMSDLSGVEMLCVNLSGRSVGDRVFHLVALELLAAAGKEVCSRLCIELTETAAVSSTADAMHFMVQARALGVRVALDDFGAGVSSFGYLKSLPVDLLKIDGQFIAGLSDDPLNEAAVRCFVEVARVRGLKTAAEFVDSRATLERVRELGVDFGQGFLLHQPEPIDGESLAAIGVCRAAANPTEAGKGATRPTSRFEKLNG